MMHSSRKTTTSQSGFTIVELMIALSVLALLLTVSSLTLIGLGKLYTKAANSAKTQDITRNILDDVSSNLKLGANTPQVVTSGGTTSICIGSERYTFQLHHILTSSSTDHALWRDEMTTSGSCSTLVFGSAPTPTVPAGGIPSVPGSGVELLSQNMQLTDFSVTSKSATTFAIKLTVAYGPDDLVKYDAATDRTSCHGTATQYCAFSSLSQTVVQRLQN